MSDQNALEVRSLVKEYGKHRAVDNLSFSVAKGTIFGLLGPNGAGKTTTLECIEGLRDRTSGEISVLGIDPATHNGALYRAIGVQLQTSGIPGMMTPRDAMRFFGRYHGIIPDMALLDRFGLGGRKDVPYASLSVGQKRRLSLAVASAHSPDVLFLDEPTAGLDVESRLELHALIREMRDAGRTVVMATHDMAEAENLCDELAIIIGGKLAVIGTPSQVTAAGDKRTTITVSTENGSVIQVKPRLPGSSLVSVKDGYVQYQTHDPGSSVVKLLAFIEEQQDVLVDLRVERPSLEQRFMEITKNKETAA